MDLLCNVYKCTSVQNLEFSKTVAVRYALCKNIRYMIHYKQNILKSVYLRSVQGKIFFYTLKILFSEGEIYFRVYRIFILAIILGILTVLAIF